MTLLRDPFGVRALYYVEHGGVFYFASELKQLLAMPGLPVEPTRWRIHKYLTFSFVPGEDVPVKGIKRLHAGPRRRDFREGQLAISPLLHAERGDRSRACDQQDGAVRARPRASCRDAVAGGSTARKRSGSFSPAASIPPGSATG